MFVFSFYLNIINKLFDIHFLFIVLFKIAFRIILQMSVWQEWLLRLCFPLYPSNYTDANFLFKLLHLFRILLSYGIFYEYGSWQVLVDTFALIHVHLSEERFLYLKQLRQIKQMVCVCVCVH